MSSTADGPEPTFERDRQGDVHLRVRTRVQRSLEETFAFFAQAENLEAITPPMVHFRITTPLPIEMREGARIAYSLRVHGIPVQWRTRIDAWEPGVRFVDRQVRGPYKVWVHEHAFTADGDDATWMDDHVRYRAPFGRLADALLVRRDLRRIFAYRSKRVAELLAPRVR